MQVKPSNWVESPADTQFFITEFLGNGELAISNYRLRSKRMRKLRQLVSPKRFITVKDCVIYPGHARGTTTIGDCDYNLTYAWRGLTEYDINYGQKQFNQVLSWVVQIEPVKGSYFVVKKMAAVRKGILIDEGLISENEPEKIAISRAEWMERECGITSNRLRDYRRFLQRDAKDFLEKRLATAVAFAPFAERALRDAHSDEGIEQKIDAIRGKKTVLVCNPRYHRYQYGVPPKIEAYGDIPASYTEALANEIK